MKSPKEYEESNFVQCAWTSEVEVHQYRYPDPILDTPQAENGAGEQATGSHSSSHSPPTGCDSVLLPSPTATAEVPQFLSTYDLPRTQITSAPCSNDPSLEDTHVAPASSTLHERLSTKEMGSRRPSMERFLTSYICFSLRTE